MRASNFIKFAEHARCGRAATRARSASAGRAARALLALVSLLGGMDAHAGRPLVTEDAPVLPAGECAVESYVGHFRADAAAAVRLVSSQLGCDVGHGTQLSIAAARVSPADGSGDFLTLAGKTALAAGQQGAAEWSVAYGAVLRRAAGQHLPLDQSYVTLVRTVPLTPRLSAHVNLGWTGVRQPHGNTTRWAMALEQAASDDVHLVAEAFADDHDQRPWLQAGFWASVTPKVSVNASYGRHTGADRARALTLGVTVGF
ncbi:hypothetical protein [Roseateles sp. BYS96W]|uniref:Transporter n=1 Tax=Pelomonas nitida TaxID=3299027 RepID=A0ABW7G4X7_9BURK